MSSNPVKCPIPLPQAVTKSRLKKVSNEQVREDFCNYYKRQFKVSLVPPQIYLGQGLLGQIFSKIFDNQGLIIMPTPSFDLPETQDLNIQYLPTNYHDNYKILAADLEDLCFKNQKMSKYLYLENPNQLSGVLYSDEELKNLAKLAKKYDLIFITNESHGEVYFEKRPHGLAYFLTDSSIVYFSLDLGTDLFEALSLPNRLKKLAPADQHIDVSLNSQAASVFTDIDVENHYKTCSDLYRMFAYYTHQKLLEMDFKVADPGGGMCVYAKKEGKEIQIPLTDFDGPAVLVKVRQGWLDPNKFVETNHPNLVDKLKTISCS